MSFRPVEIAGVATTVFGRFLDRSLGSLTHEVVAAALADAGLEPSLVQSAVFANAAGGLLTGQEMIRGQVALRGTGIEGVPVINAENACASGSTAAHIAWLQVASGTVDVAIAVGVEKLCHEDKSRSFAAIASGTDLNRTQADDANGVSPMMLAYAREARAYAGQNGSVGDALAAIAVKNREFAANNPKAQFRAAISAEDVRASRLVYDPLRVLTCSPLTDGAAAIVFRSGDQFAISRDAVRVAASVVRGWQPGKPVVNRTATDAYQMADLTPPDIDVFQLHDACAFAELAQYEQVGIAPPGGGIRAAIEGRTGLQGESPTNTDGGLLSRGHALGATGIAQLVEVTLQLSDRAGPRQVANATHGFAMNAGGWMGDDYAAAVATILTKT